MKRLFIGIAAAAIVSTIPLTADAGPGLRLGLTDDPDTLFAGAHWRVPFARGGQGVFVVQPGVDFGIGIDDPTNFMIRGTAHFAYMFPVASDILLYPLLGPSLILVNRDRGDDDDDTDTEAGVDLGIGAQFRQFALELWVGLSDDTTDLTLAISFNL